MVQPTVQPERGHQRRKEIPGHSQRHIQERPSTQKDFQQEHLEASYSCMTNFGNNINAHNKSIISEKPRSPEKTCNCRSKPACPLNGKCLTSNIIYQATVESDGRSETYIGLTANEFKTRYCNHTTSFRHESKRHSTELSKHIWSLKDKNKDYRISWKIVARPTLLKHHQEMQSLLHRKISHYMQTRTLYP